MQIEVHALLGENGARKSTLLNILHGIYQATEGKVTLLNKEVHFKTPNEAIENGISKVHQEINVVKDLTVGQNITLGQEIRRGGIFVDYKKTNEKVDKLLQQLVHLMHNVDNASLSVLPKYSKFGFVNKKALLENYLEKSEELRVHPEDPFFLTANLSGGNQQKVILVRWLSTDSKILIFDEPTKGIDVATKIEIYKLMDNARKNGKSIIMISSELPEIMRISDRIVVMYEGEITATLQNTNDLKDNEILEYAMGGKQK